MNDLELEPIFAALYGEVVVCDIYRLRSLDFVPEIVFDIGANIGIFSRFARSLFPKALIVSLEPDQKNRDRFDELGRDDNMVLIPRALGKGKIFHGLTAANGAGEVYLSAGLGYPEDLMIRASGVLEISSISSLQLGTLIRAYWVEGMRSLIKIDCEGAENTIWGGEDSMATLRQMDYIAMEIHTYSMTGSQQQEVREAEEGGLRSLEATHTCERQGVNFWARKRDNRAV